MKKLFLFCFVACLSVIASAQKAYFVYLQTEDLSPFYVRMADKVFSSSTAGYLILPNLADTTYMMGIGFPKSNQPEIRFAVTISQADKGYLLKNFSDGLSLFDMEDLSVVKPFSANKDNTAYETKTDKFSSVLSKAADDPSLLKVPVVKKEEPKVEPEKKETVAAKIEEPKPEQKQPVVVKADEEKTNDTAVQKPVETVDAKVETKDEQLNIAAPASSDLKPKTEEQQSVSNNTGPAADYKLSVVVRRAESSTTEGFGIVYLDKMQDRTDTIRILIPPSKFKLEDTQPMSNADAGKKGENPVSISDAPKTIAKEMRADTTFTEAQSKTEQRAPGEKPAKTPMATSCKELASDKDFMKLRKNMAAKSTDDEMIFEARKAFKIRCYTTEQIRYLSTLFLTPAGKYQFFDAAYNYVADKENFTALQSEIKNEYYSKRFKALVGE